MKKILIFTVMLLIIPFTLLQAQIDTLKVGQTFKNYKNLKPSVSKYMLYSEKAGKYSPVDVVWVREVQFLNENGKDIVIVRQQLDAKDTLQSSVKTAVLTANTFVPIRDVTENTLSRMTTSFSEAKVSLSMDSLKTGANRKMEVDLKVAGYDFEADEELFSILPLKENYKVAIPFYQPGTGRPSKYYLYEVTGTEFIDLPDGGKIECWKIQSQYTGGTSAWWISKKNQQFIKQQRARADGGFLNKVRLM